jgi:hypothetical protein
MDHERLYKRKCLKSIKSNINKTLKRLGRTINTHDKENMSVHDWQLKLAYLKNTQRIYASTCQLLFDSNLLDQSEHDSCLATFYSLGSQINKKLIRTTRIFNKLPTLDN